MGVDSGALRRMAGDRGVVVCDGFVTVVVVMVGGWLSKTNELLTSMYESRTFCLRIFYLVAFDELSLTIVTPPEVV